VGELESEPRERILDAASHLIAARGYTATTVRDIATAAGMNLAMIHYYFGNKEGLYRAIFEEKVFAVQRLLADAANSEGTCRERLERFVCAYARFLCRHSHFARIIQQEMINGGAMFKEIFRPQISRNYAMLRGIIEEGIRLGEFRNVDPQLAPISVVGMIAFFIIAQPVISAVAGIVPDAEGFEARLAAHTIDMLTHGLVPAGDARPAEAHEPEPIV
jgi:AcrR family transcriptional regulator